MDNRKAAAKTAADQDLLGSANDNAELQQRVKDEANMLLEDHGADATPEDIDAVIRHQIWMFGGEARMGAIDRMVLDRLRRMATDTD